MLAKKPPISRATFKTTKPLEKAIGKAEKEIQTEASKQIDILYHAAAIALYRYHDWKQLRIERFVEVSNSTYDDCASSNDLSMIQLLYDETGIELMRNDGKQHWYEVIYLNSAIDDGRPLTPYQWLAMRQNQVKWVAAQITASILLALHRKEKWGLDRCGKFFQELEEVKQEFNCDPEVLKAQSKKETGFVIREGFELMDETQK